MALTPFTLKEFGGLDLRAAPDDAACIDVLNVDIEPGQIRTRPGTSEFSTVSDGANGMYGFISTSGTRKLIAVDGATIYALESNGTSLANQASSDDTHSFARFGGTSDERVYIARPGGNQIVRYDTTSGFTSPAGLATLTGRLVAVQAPDNRLVNARGNAANYSRVWFSDPGAPETFGANNWVDIRPGDGEKIQALVSWRETLFAFKESHFAVFYGNSTQPDGDVEFNYRTVDTGIGCRDFRVACAAPDGVYFASKGYGVWRTTGGPPVKVSGALDPILSGDIRNSVDAHPFFTYGDDPTTWTPKAIEWCAGRLYVTMTRNTDTLIFVYRPDTGIWSVWSRSTHFGNQLATWDILGNGPELFASNSVRGSLDKFDPDVTTDAGSTAIVSRYRAGFTDLGDMSEKVFQAFDLWGTGTVDFKGSRDFGSLGSASSAVMGTAPAIAAARVPNLTKPAALFSWQVGASSGAWGLQRITGFLSGSKRAPSRTP